MEDPSERSTTKARSSRFIDDEADVGASSDDGRETEDLKRTRSSGRAAFSDDDDADRSDSEGLIPRRSGGAQPRIKRRRGIADDEDEDDQTAVKQEVGVKKETAYGAASDSMDDFIASEDEPAPARSRAAIVDSDDEDVRVRRERRIGPMNEDLELEEKLARNRAELQLRMERRIDSDTSSDSDDNDREARAIVRRATQSTRKRLSGAASFRTDRDYEDDEEEEDEPNSADDDGFIVDEEGNPIRYGKGEEEEDDDYGAPRRRRPGASDRRRGLDDYEAQAMNEGKSALSALSVGEQRRLAMMFGEEGIADFFASSDRASLEAADKDAAGVKSEAGPEAAAEAPLLARERRAAAIEAMIRSIVETDVPERIQAVNLSVTATIPDLSPFVKPYQEEMRQRLEEAESGFLGAQLREERQRITQAIAEADVDDKQAQAFPVDTRGITSGSYQPVCAHELTIEDAARWIYHRAFEPIASDPARVFNTNGAGHGLAAVPELSSVAPLIEEVQRQNDPRAQVTRPAAIIPLIVNVLRMLCIQKVEVSYMWTYRSDYFKSPAGPAASLAESDLWVIYDFAQRYSRLLPARVRLLAIARTLPVRDPGLEQFIVLADAGELDAARRYLSKFEAQAQLFVLRDEDIVQPKSELDPSGSPNEEVPPEPTEAHVKAESLAGPSTATERTASDGIALAPQDDTATQQAQGKSEALGTAATDPTGTEAGPKLAPSTSGKEGKKSLRKAWSEFASEFIGLTTQQVRENFVYGYQRHRPRIPEELPFERIDAIAAPRYPNREARLAKIRREAAQRIGADPLLQQEVRARLLPTLFVSTIPTVRGVRELEPDHKLFRVRRITDMPIQTLARSPTLFVMMQQAEDEGLVTIHLHNVRQRRQPLPQDLAKRDMRYQYTTLQSKAQLCEQQDTKNNEPPFDPLWMFSFLLEDDPLLYDLVMGGFQTHPADTPVERFYNEQRYDILRIALVSHLLPIAVDSIRHNLLQLSREAVAREAVSKGLRPLLLQAPYTPPVDTKRDYVVGEPDSDVEELRDGPGADASVDAAEETSNTSPKGSVSRRRGGSRRRRSNLSDDEDDSDEHLDDDDGDGDDDDDDDDDDMALMSSNRMGTDADVEVDDLDAEILRARRRQRKLEAKRASQERRRLRQELLPDGWSIGSAVRGEVNEPLAFVLLSSTGAVVAHELFHVIKRRGADAKAIAAAESDPAGGRTKMGENELQERLRTEIARLHELIRTYKPSLIVMDASSPHSRLHRQEFLDLISPRFPKVTVELVDPSVGRVFMHSPRSASEFPEVSPLIRQAISTGRYVLNPLYEMCYLNHTSGGSNELLSLDLHPLQHVLPEQLLLQAIEYAFLATTARLGVDLNNAAVHRHIAASLRFVPGLGVHKAKSLISLVTRRGYIIRRSQLVQPNQDKPVDVKDAPKSESWLGQPLGPLVFSNCSGYLKLLPTKGMTTRHRTALFWLERTRIHPDDAKLACYVITQAVPPSYLSILSVPVDSYVPSPTDNKLSEREATEINKLLRRITLQELHHNILELDLKAFADQRQEAYGLLQHDLLEMIGQEILTPYSDPPLHYPQSLALRKFGELSPARLFKLCTNESYETLFPGKIIAVTVKQITVAGVVVSYADAGLRGFIAFRNTSDQAANLPRVDDRTEAEKQRLDFLAGRFKVGAVVKARILRLDEAKFTIELSTRSSDLARPWSAETLDEIQRSPEGRYLRVGKHPDDAKIAPEIRQDKLKFIPRLIDHPQFRNVSREEAEHLVMEDKSVPHPAVFHPSEFGIKYLEVTWLVRPGTVMHVTIEEHGKIKGDERKLGATLHIKDYVFHDLDEIFTRYVEPVVLNQRAVMKHKSFRPETNKEEILQYLQRESQSRPRHLPYCLTFREGAPGVVVFNCHLQGKLIRESATVHPKGFRFEADGHMVRTPDELIADMKRFLTQRYQEGLQRYQRTAEEARQHAAAQAQYGAYQSYMHHGALSGQAAATGYPAGAYPGMAPAAAGAAAPHPGYPAAGGYYPPAPQPAYGGYTAAGQYGAPGYPSHYPQQPQPGQLQAQQSYSGYR